MKPLRRAYASLPDPARDRLRAIRHGETAAQRRTARLIRERAAGMGRSLGDGELLLGPLTRPQRVTVVERYDAWNELRLLRDAISEALAQAGIEHVIPPLPSNRRPIVAVDAADAIAARAAIAKRVALPGCWVVDETLAGLRHQRPATEAVSDTDESTGLRVYRHVAAPSGLVLGDHRWYVRLEYWEAIMLADVPRPDGEEFQIGTRVAPKSNTAVAYLEPAQWQQAQQTASHWLPDWPANLLAFEHPVDVVYTWVDGDDPEWLRRKAAVLGQLATGEHNADSLAANRFISRDELKYSLRSIEMFASWVNHVWVITDGQTPAWLRTDHPGLTVVDHRKIFADPAALPVFNSHAIESQLHHIPGLAEHYLYLNDDMFLGRPVRPENFFHGNGISKYFPSPAVLDVTPRSVRDLAVASAGKRNRELIERDFGRVITNKLRHTPQPQTRRVLDEMEERYPELFDSVMRSRFRHPDDFSIPSALSQYYAFATGQAVTSRIRYGYLDIAASNAALVLSRWRRRRSFECFCLNDTSSDPDTAMQRDAVVAGFLQDYFPLASSYEISC